MDDIVVTWRGPFTNDALNALHADAFEHPVFDDDWRTQVHAHSLGWVTAVHAGDLVGFVNVPWDGGMHAWVQDLVVAKRAQRQGIGVKLIEAATKHSTAAGCEWLHVDFDAKHAPFYFDACGFTATDAGLIRLRNKD